MYTSNSFININKNVILITHNKLNIRLHINDIYKSGCAISITCDDLVYEFNRPYKF